MAVSGERIRQYREKRNLLQHDLASKLRARGYGTTQVTVSRWENGQEPRAHVLPALAQELGCTVDELYDEDDEEAAQAMPADLLEGVRALKRLLAMVDA